MQNAPMVTRSDKPKDFVAPRTPSRTHDFSMDPLPVPDAVESDSDTAWGLWENTLHAHDDKAAQEEEPPVFDDTVPSQLTEYPPEDPKP
jgi:hypothetical protein